MSCLITCKPKNVNSTKIIPSSINKGISIYLNILAFTQTIQFLLSQT